ncbi:hypothetical protein EXIGLDRAFT_757866, partial [Exidia glandulosa HHB12029]
MSDLKHPLPSPNERDVKRIRIAPDPIRGFAQCAKRGEPDTRAFFSFGRHLSQLPIRTAAGIDQFASWFHRIIVELETQPLPELPHLQPFFSGLDPAQCHDLVASDSGLQQCLEKMAANTLENEPFMHFFNYRTPGFGYKGGNLPGAIRVDNVGAAVTTAWKTKLRGRLRIDLLDSIREACGRVMAYPSPDCSIRDFLVKYPGTVDPTGSEDRIQDTYRFFLRLLFFSIAHWVKNQNFPSYESAVLAWNLFIGSKRKEIYNGLVTEIKNQGTIPSDPTSRAMRSAFDELQQTLSALAQSHERIPDSPEQPASADAMSQEGSPVGASPPAESLPVPDIFQGVFHSPELEEHRKDYHAQFTADLERPKFHSSVIVIAYFDEAHALVDDLTQLPGSKNLYFQLLSVLNDLKWRPFFSVFLSTSSPMGQFAPPGPLAPSARMSMSERLQAPFTELPFDCGPLLPFEAERLKLADLSEVWNLAQCGRPLFWSLLEATHGPDATATADDMHALEAELMGLARGKLANSSTLERSEVGALAVLDVRLCFDHETRQSVAQRREATLVASHMRVAYSVPEHRNYIYSGYSSEPILAEAAAQTMYYWTNATSSSWKPLDTLQKLLASGLIRRGERGELVSRYLLTAAYDAAINYNPASPKIAQFNAGCSVADFLKQLFQSSPGASSVNERILDCRPDNILNGRTLRETFARSVVRITHWVKLGDSSGLSTAGLLAAFVRGVAYIGHSTQELVDHIIPVLIDRDQPLSLDNVTAILQQSKDQSRAGFSGKYDFTAEDLRIFSDLDPKLTDGTLGDSDLRSRHAHAYITILMELGVKQREKEPSSPARFETPQLTGRVTRATTTLKQNQDHIIPRYNIRAYGCSQTIYGVIKNEHEKSQCRGLLGTSNDPTQEHPRPKLASYVWKMLPLWVHGSRIVTAANSSTTVEINSYSWFKSGRPLEAVTAAVDESDEAWVDIASQETHSSQEST